MKAFYGYDFADRQSTLSIEETGQPVQPWITFSRYHSAGPLRRLDFSNGVRETRLYDLRYHPSQITVAASSTLLNWTYSTDDVGNITAIQDGLSASQNRTYGYLDYQYFLTQGDGPWGDLAWSYDRIGNRLSETRDGVTDTYTYEPSPSGNSPKLSQIQLGGGGTKSFQYDAIGSQIQVASSETVDYFYDDAKRLTTIATASGDSRTDFAYDGRSFLRSSVPTEPLSVFNDGFEVGHAACWSNIVGGTSGGTCPLEPMTEPTYSSEGSLMHLRDAGGAADRHVLYFAGRPVGILFDGLISVFFISTDHLGTPVVASTGAGGSLWDGGFEPSGADFSGAQASGVFLRFPGQWEDESWLGRGVYYNVHRWYESGAGRYGRPDPLGLRGDTHSYLYSSANPLLFIDPLAEKSRVCCTPITEGQSLAAFKHCFIQTQTDPEDSNLSDTTFGLQRVKGKGCKFKNDTFDKGGIEDKRTECGPWNDGCDTDQCVEKEFGSYPNPSDYQLTRGPNSNSFAGTVAKACGLTPPDIAGTIKTPGWGKEGRPAKNKNFECPEFR